VRDGEGFSPAFLAYGQEMATPREAILGDIEWTSKEERITRRLYDMRRAHTLLHKKRRNRDDRNRRNFDKHRTAAEFHKGDLVFVEKAKKAGPAKFSIRWEGPFRVTNVTSDKLTYTLERNGKEITRHISHIMRFIQPREPCEVEPEPLEEKKEAEPPREFEQRERQESEKQQKPTKPEMTALPKKLKFETETLAREKYIIAQIGRDRYLGLTQGASEEGKVWFQYLRSKDPPSMDPKRKFLKVWTDPQGEGERWGNNPRKGEEIMWSECSEPQILISFERLDRGRLPVNIFEKWTEMYGREQPICH
jgi:hypothetical protein